MAWHLRFPRAAGSKPEESSPIGNVKSPLADWHAAGICRGRRVLASERASYVNGTSIAVDGGLVRRPALASMAAVTRSS